MIVLNTTTQKLQVVLGGAVATNQLQVEVFFASTRTSYPPSVSVEAPQLSTTNGATAVDICDAPATLVVRHIGHITVRNRDTASVILTIRLNDNGTLYTLIEITLAVNEHLYYASAPGWYVIDASGNIKSTIPSVISVTIIDAKGDLIVGSAADTAVRLAVGADNLAFIADAAQASGVKWALVPVLGGGTGASTAAAARTNFGLVAGGAGDIWAEKAGDTFTGDVTISKAVVILAIDGTGTTRSLLRFSKGGVVQWSFINEGDVADDLVIDSSGIGVILRLAKTTGNATFAGTLAASNLSGTNTGDNPGVTSVSGTAPIASSGGTTPVISLNAAGVDQAKLKTATGDISTSSNDFIDLTLPGGAFGFYPQVFTSVHASATVEAQITFAKNSTDTPVTIIALRRENALGSVHVRQGYVQASPPYDLGDGEVPLFIFAVVNSLGVIESAWSAPDPVWANNGPTSIRADFVDAQGRAFKLECPRIIKARLLDPATRDAELAKLEAKPVLVEITQAVKQADMPLIPHPFQGNDLTGKTVVLLDPVGALTAKLRALHDSGESINALLHGDYLRVGNVALSRTGPPGVMPVAVSWRLT